jgi:hypothetical protein
MNPVCVYLSPWQTHNTQAEQNGGSKLLSIMKSVFLTIQIS